MPSGGSINAHRVIFNVKPDENLNSIDDDDIPIFALYRDNDSNSFTLMPTALWTQWIVANHTLARD
jgi:hypothetical protein